MFETAARTVVSAVVGAAFALTAAVVLTYLAGVEAGPTAWVKLDVCNVKDGTAVPLFPAQGSPQNLRGSIWVDPATVHNINEYDGINCVKLTLTTGQINIAGSIEYVYCKLYGGPVCEEKVKNGN